MGAPRADRGEPVLVTLHVTGGKVTETAKDTGTEPISQVDTSFGAGETVTGTAGGCTPAQDTAYCPATLHPGETATFSYDVEPPVKIGAKASVKIHTPSGVEGPYPAVVSAAGGADLAVDAAGPANTSHNAPSVRYAIVVTNKGPADALAAGLNVRWGVGSRPIKVEATTSGAGPCHVPHKRSTNLTCTLEPLAAHASKHVVVHLTLEGALGLGKGVVFEVNAHVVGLPLPDPQANNFDVVVTRLG
jgi:hypothetical protein